MTQGIIEVETVVGIPGSEGGSGPRVSSGRPCSICGEALSAKRLAARPNAGQCVPCLEASGDVPRTLRFDEGTKTGTLSTFFRESNNLTALIRRQQTHTPSSRFLSEATDSPALEIKAPERSAERRAESSPFFVIYSLPDNAEDLNEILD